MGLDDGEAAAASGLTRRSFLAGANALVLLALIEGCKSSHKSAVSATPGGTPTPSSSPTVTASPVGSSAAATSEDVIALLRQAVQASPDYLKNAAAEAVATKDAATIAAFVRDKISVIPSWSKGDDPIYTRRWGSAPTLRGGAGTVRDRADLLVELLTAAGFSATVMTANLPPSIDLPTLYQLRGSDFEPDQKLLDQAAALLSSPPATPTPVASSSPDSGSAAQAIAAAMPAALQTATIRPDLLPSVVPMAAVTMAGGATQYFFALGDLDGVQTAPAGLTAAPDASPTPNVTVTISGVANTAPGSSTPRGQLVQLVTGSWPAEEVFGRQVLLSFVPPSGPSGFLTASPADQPVRVPMLRVQTELAAYPSAAIVDSSAPGSSLAAPSPATSVPATTSASSDLIATGPAITMMGEILTPATSSTTSAQGSYGSITTLTANQRKAAIASAASLTATVKATVFPEIDLDVAVLDADGKSVDGLDASAFTVTENGTAVPWLMMLANTASSSNPRVLVAYDTTGSVAETWASAAAKAAFEQSLATTLTATAAETPFTVQVLGLDQAEEPQESAWAAPTQAGLLAALAAAGGNDSVVWGAASGTALDQGVVAVVMISDFQSGDPAGTIGPAQRRIAASGVPVICLPIGKPDKAAIATMIALSGGVQLDPNAPSTAAALAALLKPLVGSRALSSYRLRYAASAVGPTTRSVSISLVGRPSPKATATYTVPSQPGTPWSFVGLYVSIDVGGVGVQPRHLAGLDLVSGSTPSGALDDAAATAETRAAIYGITTVAIEPGNVTAAAILDDILGSLQSLQPVLELAKTATPEQLLTAAAKKGVRRVPPALQVLLQPPTADANPHAVQTMRIAIIQERANADGSLATSLDLPPTLNTIEPLGSDPIASFAAGLAMSTLQGLEEAAVSTSSAFNLLAGKSLTFVAASDHNGLNTFVNSLPAAQQDAWSAELYSIFFQYGLHFLLPTGGSVSAFWVVDPASGATTAVLLDGSGGAVSNFVDCSSGGLDLYSFVLNMLNAFLAALSLTCLLGTAFFCLGEITTGVFLIAGVLLAYAGYENGSSVTSSLVSLVATFVPFEALPMIARATLGVDAILGVLFGTANSCS